MNKFNIFFVILIVTIIALASRFNHLKQSPEAEAIFSACTQSESKSRRSEMTEDNFILILNEITITCMKTRNDYVINRLTYGLFGTK